MVPLDRSKVPPRMVGGTRKGNKVDSCKAINEAVLNVTAPTPSTAAEGALANRAQRRSRVQAKVGEVLTAETSIAQLEK